jgi:hypothetical protein
MKSIFNRFIPRAFIALIWFFANGAQAGNEEHWLCKYEPAHGDKVSYSAEYKISGKKLFGPYSDIARRRLEYQIIQNNSLGLVAINSYANYSEDRAIPKTMGVTIITLQKGDGIFKLSGVLVGVKEEDIYHGKCNLKKT